MTLLLLFAGGKFIPLPDVPSSRQVIPPLETRVLIPSLQTRTMSPAAQSRITTPSVEVRTMTVPSDSGRIVTVDLEEP